MSGDVQPRKRKDKKKKKDELGLEEPRGTAAVLGEGDVFIHSYHEHGTGGHWCAKIIFFSLLAILVTLIGLIILENRGLSELEANSVESRYSGVLEGWIEDAPEDDHHDEHTLELKHSDVEELSENDHEQEIDEDGEHDAEEENNEEHDSEEIEDINENNDGDDDQSDEEDNEDIAYSAYHIYEEQDNNLDIEDDIDEDDGKHSEELINEQSEEDNIDEEYNISQNDEKDNDDDNEENDDNEDSDTENNVNENDDDEWHNNEEDHDEEEDDDDSGEVERIEQEVSDEDIVSSEVPVLEEIKDADDEESEEDINENDEESSPMQDDDDEPPVERITLPPAGKPYTEIEEETIQKTPDTLAEEEEYEKQQEELRREREAQSSQGMWLKLVVGGALLVATHVVVRRASAPRDEPETEEQIDSEEPSVIERRMTLIPKTQETPEITRRTSIPSQEEIINRTVSVTQSVPEPNPEYDIKNQSIIKKENEETFKDNDDERELYSEEDEEEEEEDVEEEVILKKPEVKDIKSVPANTPPTEEPPDEDEDVEIIDEEQIEEELEDEEDEVEEEISDVDDAELLSRLEAKYGRLPEPERPGKNKGGGNSIEEDWPGEPSDPFWSQQLDLAEEELRQGAWSACERRASVAELRNSARAQWLAAKSLDLMAEAKRDNRLLSRAITAYLQLLKMNEKLPDQKLIDVAQRAIDRIQFRGTYLNAEPVYRLLIRRFPDNIHYRNNLTVCFLMANRADLAGEVLKEALRLWPNDRVALAHYGFVLKNEYKKLEEAVIYLQKALEGDAGAANEPRFHYHLGDALLQLGRFEEAHEVHKRGTALGHFLSPAQRSLYNVPRLKSRPWWPIKETPYAKLARALENSWREILREGLAAKALYESEKEGLKERGEWSQLDIFVRGKEIPGRCKEAPVTCSIVRQEAAAAGCRRGQVKFSSVEPGTHVRPHVGPTNCRLRVHLGLSNTKDTYIRVDKETRQWEVGKVFIFDDSFEHEVWHNGTGSRLVLIVDVWHPDLTPAERRTLPAI